MGNQRSMPGCLSLVLFGLLLLFPFFLANALLASLDKLGLSPTASLLVAMGIFLGGVVNIPVARLEREHAVESPNRMFGMQRFLGPEAQPRPYTILAVNLGGAVIPALLALYEIARVLGADGAVTGMAVTIGANVLVCYLLARPIPDVGIALSPLVPAVVAVIGALLLAPDAAPQVAFAAGVLGPLVGADLLHLREIKKVSTGIASIGGAGTFDGIVIAGLIAVLLA